MSQNFNDIFIQFTDESSYIKAEKVRTDFVSANLQINKLVFLFGARDIWFVIGVPIRTFSTNYLLQLFLGYIETLQGHAKKKPIEKMHNSTNFSDTSFKLSLMSKSGWKNGKVNSRSHVPI